MEEFKEGPTDLGSDTHSQPNEVASEAAVDSTGSSIHSPHESPATKAPPPSEEPPQPHSTSSFGGSQSSASFHSVDSQSSSSSEGMQPGVASPPKSQFTPDKSQPHHSPPSSSPSSSSASMWRFIALVAIVVLAVSLFTGGFSFGDKSSSPTGAASVSLEQASSQVLELVNTQLLPPGLSAQLLSAIEENGLYAVELSVEGQEVTSYLTKDGALFFPQGINVNELEQLLAAEPGLTPPPVVSGETLEDPDANLAQETEETGTQAESESVVESTPPLAEEPEVDGDGLTLDLTETQAEPTPLSSGTVEVVAKKFRFVPSEIKVKQGEEVILSFTSADIEHSFLLDAFAIVQTIPAGQTVEVKLTPDEPGTFEFSSGSNEAMVGQLIVE